MANSRVASRRRVTGLCAAGVVGVFLAGILPAGAAEPFDSYTDMGGLRLQLGITEYGALPMRHDPVPPRFVYESKEQPGRGTAFTQGPEQIFTLSGKCGAALAAAPKLAKLTTGPIENTLGIGPDSLGVYDGPKGVGCYRITAGLNESLRFDIGPDLKTMGARSFYRLELDIEVKQNAKFELQILRGGVPSGDPWVMMTGSSIIPPYSTVPGATRWACTARSDSGPDAGPGDNCRWIINEVGDGFILRATAGEGSLEGGGDFGSAAYDNNTVIYLTDAVVGVLGCQAGAADQSAYTDPIANPVNGATCLVTRIATGTGHVGGETCQSNVSYLMRTLPAGVGKGCEIIKNSGEQLAAILEVTFPPETWQKLPEKVNIPGYGDFALPIPNRTWVTFGTDPTQKFYPDRCDGTLVADQNGNETIDEVLRPGASGYDFIPTTDLKEWACILEDMTTSPYPESGKMQIRQKILFWGDFQGGRW